MEGTATRAAITASEERILRTGVILLSKSLPIDADTIGFFFVKYFALMRALNCTFEMPCRECADLWFSHFQAQALSIFPSIQSAKNCSFGDFLAISNHLLGRRRFVPVIELFSPCHADLYLAAMPI
jgi:hypothetical protein